MKTTRQVSSAQEKRIEKALGAKRTTNSGAGKFDKGDLFIGSDWLIEAKTCMEPRKSFSIKRDWLDKLKEEQFATSKLYRTLCFDFGDEKDRYYILDEHTFKQLIELLKNDNM